MITPPWSGVGDTDGNSAFGLYIPFMVVDRAGSSNHKNDDFQDELMAHQEDNWDDRFKDFQRVRIGPVTRCTEKAIFHLPTKLSVYKDGIRKCSA